jgi:hypothetical protein
MLNLVNSKLEDPLTFFLNLATEFFNLAAEFCDQPKFIFLIKKTPN